MKKFLFVLMIILLMVLFLAVGIWSFGIPDNYVTEKIEQMKTGPLSIRIEGFRKGLLFNFTANSIAVIEGEKELLKGTEIAGKVNPLRLVLGKALIDLRGNLYGGNVNGRLAFGGDVRETEITAGNIDISRFPYLESLGLKGNGRLSGRLLYSNKGGNLEFVLNNAVLSDFTKEGIYVPLKYFHTVRGALDLSPSADVTVKSIALEGKGIYARMKGKMKGRSADLDIEIMPEASFPDNSLFMLLERYKISEGYFDIPIKTTF